MKIIGIDPGLSGAIAILENNKVLNIFEMPVMSEGKKNKRQLNSAQLVRLLRENILKNEEVSVVVEQVNENFKVKAVNLKVLNSNVKELIEEFKFIEINHVYREDNKRADQLANMALDK